MDPPPTGPCPLSASDNDGDEDVDGMQKPARIAVVSASPPAADASAAEVTGECSFNQARTAVDTFSWRFIDNLIQEITCQGDGCLTVWLLIRKVEVK